MTPTQLLQHFDRLSEAPDAIPRLHRFILDLAVRGKLVEQDPNDEPAAELLKRIQAEKTRLVKEGKIKVQEMLPSITCGEIEYDLPPNWMPTRIGDLLTVIRGASPRPKGDPKYFSTQRTPYHWIKISDIRKHSKDRVLYDTDEFLTEAGMGKSVLLPKGTLVMTNSATIGIPIFLGFDGGCIHDGYLAFPYFPDSEISKDFFYVLVQTLQSYAMKMARGMAQLNLNTGLVRSFPLGLPPLAEQHRIVAKVDELMALCDQLEAAKAEREQSRDRLLAANLHHLNQPTDDEEAFREHVRFTFNHLPRITTRPAHIKQMRQTILNLAMCGKLVAQNPNDEPASEFLKRIHAEKVRLEKEGKTKRDKPVEAVEADTAPFAIPEIWNWARLGDLTELITKGSSPKWQGITYVSKEDGILFVTSENVGNYHLRKLDELKYVDKRFNEIEPRSILRYGDILMNLVGASIGRTAIYDLSEIANINQAVALIRLIQSTANMEPEFMLHYFNSPSAIQIMLTSQVITAQPNISLTNAREFPIPVPPLAEQRRIVAKVNELMTLCAQLETQLDTTETDSRHLLEAVLHNALSPVALR